MPALLSSGGTRGDVQPIVALALRVRDFGHEVRLCVPPDFVQRVRGFGLDPVEVRRLNFIRPSDFSYRPYGSKGVMCDSGNCQGCLDQALDVFDYTARRSEQTQLRTCGRYRGIGVAAYTEMCGMAPSRRFDKRVRRRRLESACIIVDASGKATLFSGSMSQRHGHATVPAQIAADSLRILFDDIAVVQGDTRQLQADTRHRTPPGRLGPDWSHAPPAGGDSPCAFCLP